MKPTLALLVLLAGSAASANPLDHLRTTDDIGLHKIPHTGVSHILVIPSRVGTSAFPATRLATLRKFYDPQGGPGTFRHYWQIVSGGRWDPIPTLVEPLLYPTTCPIPGRSVTNCTVTLNDISLITNHAIQKAFENILARVRDERMIDLGEFDANTATGAGQDGFFDGVIVDTDIYNGLAFPLAAFDNQAKVKALPGGTGRDLTCGIVALVPPDLHEFGHILGFIDLYNGPTLNCLMADIHSTLSPFSRQQIGWGQVIDVTSAMEFDLAPVLEGGAVLRIGIDRQYVMVENRGGQYHAELESAPAGIYTYTVDEDKLPTTALGFLDLISQRLYYPNELPPYLNVNLPIDCNLFSQDMPDSCSITKDGTEVELIHGSGVSTGYTLRLGATAPDGTIHVSLLGGPPPPSDGGVDARPDARKGDASSPADAPASGVDGGRADSGRDSAEPDAGDHAAADGPMGRKRAEDGGCHLGGSRGESKLLWLVILGLIAYRRRRPLP